MSQCNSHLLICCSSSPEASGGCKPTLHPAAGKHWFHIHAYGKSFCCSWSCTYLFISLPPHVANAVPPFCFIFTLSLWGRLGWERETGSKSPKAASLLEQGSEPGSPSTTLTTDPSLGLYGHCPVCSHVAAIYWCSNIRNCGGWLQQPLLIHREILQTIMRGGKVREALQNCSGHSWKVCGSVGEAWQYCSTVLRILPRKKALFEFDYEAGCSGRDFLQQNGTFSPPHLSTAQRAPWNGAPGGHRPLRKEWGLNLQWKEEFKNCPPPISGNLQPASTPE